MQEPYNFIENAQRLAADTFNSKFEKNVIKALEAAGFVFENHKEFYDFCVSRCTRISLPDDLNVLVVDANTPNKINVCQWRDSYDFKTEQNTFTVTYNREIEKPAKQ